MLVLMIGAAFSGCQSAESPVAEPHAIAALPAAPSEAPAEEDSANTPTAKSRSEQSDPAAQEQVQESVAKFSPPFPNRLELFEPPKRAQSAVRQYGNEGDTVELKGFIQVDEPRVVLSIDGVISPIAEGGEKYGVRVISIQPPNVVLERNRSRWIATLE
jgi:hypothetical protein